ncbi:MAG: NYN domain-containing protein [Candidatus Eiseniibacteriota bacterium]
MSRPFSAQRLALLVDVQNIYYPAKSLGDKVDFHSLLRRFTNRNLVRAIAYVVEAPDVDISPFVTALTSIGFEVKTKAIKIFDDGTRKGDIDMMLALDALSLADKVDVVCMVTGDGVYVELVHHLHARGVKVELMSFKSNTSSELLRVCDAHVSMNEEFLLGFERSRGARSARHDGRYDGRHTRSGNHGGRGNRDDRLHGGERPAYAERGPLDRAQPGDRDRPPHGDRVRSGHHAQRDGGVGERPFGHRGHVERHYGERAYQESAVSPPTRGSGPDLDGIDDDNDA